jgi:chorismate dehydratase
MMGEAAGALRLGAVPFLNGRPLVRYLDPTQPPPVELRLDVPSRLAQMMEQARLDAALLPSVEYFRNKSYRIVPGVSISADGMVESVRIFSKTPVEEIRSLALDESSRTSVALAKILLKRRLGSLPSLTSCASDDALSDVDADAMLLIGDAAMTFRSKSPTFALDLGEEWKRLTGLPFVYAMWVARRDVDTSDLSEETCLNYLRNIMRYELGKREVEALRLFQKLAAEDGLCPGGVPIAVDDR